MLTRLKRAIDQDTLLEKGPVGRRFVKVLLVYDVSANSNLEQVSTDSISFSKCGILANT